MGSKGWRGGESTRLPPIWPGFRKSWRRLHTCVEFVVGSLLCSERFFSWYSGFTLCSKTNVHLQIPLRPGIRDTKNQFVDVLPLNPFLFYLFEMVNIFSFQGACTVLNNISTDASKRHPVHCLCERTSFIAIKVTTYIEYTTPVVSSFNCTVRQYNCITCYTKLRNYVIAVRE